MSEDKYFNFPIQLLRGFLIDYKKVLQDILYCALYAHSLKLDFGDDEERFNNSASYFNVDFSDDNYIPIAAAKGKEMYDAYYDGSPKTGISTVKYWEYRNNFKSEFEILCLLANMALKSIIGKSAYIKVTNDFLFARMDGKPKSCNKEGLSPEVAKYANEYQSKKIKNALQLNGWGLVTYSRFTRGFYISYTLELEELIYHAELKREAYQVKQLKQAENDALLKVRERLKNRPP